MGYSDSNLSLEDEAEIVEKAREDDAAFEILYSHYFPKIYGYIFKRVGNREETEDLVSTIFIKVFSNLDKYQRRDCKFSAWLYRIATNSLIDYYRKAGRKKEIGIEHVEDWPDLNDQPANEVMINEQSKEVQALIKKLPDRYQEVIQLKFFAQLDNQEIAEVMKVSVNNVGVLIHRSLEKFKQIHQKYGE